LISRLASRGSSVSSAIFNAPLQPPANVHEEELFQRQTGYTGDARWIWNALFARKMEILPDRGASAFLPGLDRPKRGRGSVAD